MPNAITDPNATKFFDCLRSPDMAVVNSPHLELFIVEGDSAAEAVAQVRDANFQAVLAMQGKPMNVCKHALEKVRAYPFYESLFTALGPSSAPRFAQVLLLMDPDADGIHAGALMALFCARFYPSLIEAGRVSWVRPPVGEIVNFETGEARYFLNEPDFQRALSEHGRSNSSKYRGLAGMPPAVLARCCVHPESRVIERVLSAHISQILAYTNLNLP